MTAVGVAVWHATSLYWLERFAGRAPSGFALARRSVLFSRSHLLGVGAAVAAVFLIVTGGLSHNLAYTIVPATALLIADAILTFRAVKATIRR